MGLLIHRNLISCKGKQDTLKMEVELRIWRAMAIYKYFAKGKRKSNHSNSAISADVQLVLKMCSECNPDISMVHALEKERQEDGN